MKICATSVAWRCHTGGLPYCWRVSTSHSAWRVVGSPSLIGGKWTARIGRDRDTERPMSATASTARGKSQLRAETTAETSAAADNRAAGPSGSERSSPHAAVDGDTAPDT